MIKISEHLFHIIRPNGEDNSSFPFIGVSKSFDSIIKHGAILTRDSMNSTKDLNEKYKRLSNERPGSWNRNDSISICTFSGDDPILKEIYPSNRFNEDDIRAFDVFALNTNAITLILNRNLLNHLKINYKCLRMPDEIQIIGDIPLSYVIAVGLYDETPIITNRHLNKRRKEHIIYNLEELFNKIRIVRKILCKNNKSIPIINNISGKEFSSLEEEKKLLLTL